MIAICICRASVLFATVATWLQRLLQVQSQQVPELIRWCVGGLKWSVTTAAVAGALLMTTQQLPVWKNSDALWSHAMQRVPELSVVRIQLALTKYDSGQRREAIRILQTALLQCEPDDLDRKRMQDSIQQMVYGVNDSNGSSTTSHLAIITHCISRLLHVRMSSLFN